MSEQLSILQGRSLLLRPTYYRIFAELEKGIEYGIQFRVQVAAIQSEYRGKAKAKEFLIFLN